MSINTHKQVESKQHMAPLTSMQKTTNAFTNDFFNDFSETIEDNSFDISKEMLREKMADKSLIIDQIKSEAVSQMQSLMAKVQTRLYFQQIWLFGLRKLRREAKTQSSITKKLLKIDLWFQLKKQSRVNNAWMKIIRFTKNYKMSEYEPPINAKIARLETIFRRIADQLLLLAIKDSFMAISNAGQFYDKIEVFSHIVDEIVQVNRNLGLGFKAIQAYDIYIGKAVLLIHCVDIVYRDKLRNYLTEIRNSCLGTATVPPTEGVQQLLIVQSSQCKAHSLNKDINYHPHNVNQHQHKQRVNKQLKFNKLTCKKKPSKNTKKVDNESQKSIASGYGSISASELNAVAESQKIKINMNCMNALVSSFREKALPCKVKKRAYENHFHSLEAMNSERLPSEQTDFQQITNLIEPQINTTNSIKSSHSLGRKKMNSPLIFVRSSGTSSINQKNPFSFRQKSLSLKSASLKHRNTSTIYNRKESRSKNIIPFKSQYYQNVNNREVLEPNKWLPHSIQTRLKLLTQYAQKQSNKRELKKLKLESLQPISHRLSQKKSANNLHSAKSSERQTKLWAQEGERKKLKSKIKRKQKQMRQTPQSRKKKQIIFNEVGSSYYPEQISSTRSKITASDKNLYLNMKSVKAVNKKYD